MPPTASKRRLFLATVTGNAAVCRDHHRLTLSAPGFPPAVPGQFVQLRCDAPTDHADEPDLHEWASPTNPGLRTAALVAPTPLLRRPFSLAGVGRGPDGHPELEVILRVVGLGSTRLGQLDPGQRIDLLGPLGNGFPMPQPGQTAVLLGGGVGIPPMIFVAEAIRKAGVGPVIAINGVTTAQFLPLKIVGPVGRSATPSMCVEEFARHGAPAVIATDDGSLGFGGLATQAMISVIEGLALPPEQLVVYACGPERMMRSAAEWLTSRSIRTWVCMERSMACGIGTCQSCVCRAQPPDQADWTYKLVCTDGPIFDARNILWD